MIQSLLEERARLVKAAGAAKFLIPAGTGVLGGALGYQAGGAEGAGIGAGLGVAAGVAGVRGARSLLKDLNSIERNHLNELSKIRMKTIKDMEKARESQLTYTRLAAEAEKAPKYKYVDLGPASEFPFTKPGVHEGKKVKDAILEPVIEGGRAKLRVQNQAAAQAPHYRSMADIEASAIKGMERNLDELEGMMGAAKGKMVSRRKWVEKLSSAQMEKDAGVEKFLGVIGKGRDVARAGWATLAAPHQAQWAEALSRLRHPIEGIRKGWKEYAPLEALRTQQRLAQQAADATARATGKAAKTVEDPVAKLKATSEAQKGLPWYALGRPGILPGSTPKPGRLFSSEKGHLFEQNVPLGQIAKEAPSKLQAAGGVVKQLAERGSRSGWTGQGRMTKYLPVGGKGFTAIYGASSVPGVVQAAKGGPVGPTGEGGAYEKGIGLAGGLAGWTAGAGLGILPMAALGLGAEYAGSKLGRIVDRMRSGANLRTAVSAPSPTQAQQQLQNIQRYYGQPQPPQPPAVPGAR